VATSVEKDAVRPVAPGLGSGKRSPFGVSRQSLEGLFSEVRIDGVLRSSPLKKCPPSICIVAC
jgi:hypothetical protein